MKLRIFKYGMFLYALLTFSITSAQTIEQEIAKKSCECIQTKLSAEGQISNAQRQKCISGSADEVLKSKDPQEVKGLRKIWKKSRKDLKSFTNSLRNAFKKLIPNKNPQT